MASDVNELFRKLTNDLKLENQSHKNDSVHIPVFDSPVSSVCNSPGRSRPSLPTLGSSPAPRPRQRPSAPSLHCSSGVKAKRPPFVLPVDSGSPKLGFPARQHEPDLIYRGIIQQSGQLKLGGRTIQCSQDDLESLYELGSGTCGHVYKMSLKGQVTAGSSSSNVPAVREMAVKRMRRSSNEDENKRIIMDLDVVRKSHDCPFIVECYGFFISPDEVWICMELMSTCLDKLLKRTQCGIPEEIIGKMTVSIVNALAYLKDRHGLIHRDIKPSNVLLDESGSVKLCDFGISGRLVDSKAKTRTAGCAAYMAPERIDPPDPTRQEYDIRADVWSLGITLVELATGEFPYKNCFNDFEMLTCVLERPPPKLPSSQRFSMNFRSFVDACLTKDVRRRPKYAALLGLPFIQKYAADRRVDVGAWFAAVNMTHGRLGSTSSTSSSCVGGSCPSSAAVSPMNTSPPSGSCTPVVQNGHCLAPGT